MESAACQELDRRWHGGFLRFGTFPDTAMKKHSVFLLGEQIEDYHKLVISVICMWGDSMVATAVGSRTH